VSEEDMKLYTVIVTESNDHDVRVPAICFNNNQEPALFTERQPAEDHKNILSEWFTNSKYEVKELV
jgi:hypothetical protein